MPPFRTSGVIATLFAASALVSITGCDTSAGKADKQVQQNIEAAIPNINGTSDDRAAAGTKLDAAYAETNASPVSRANVQELRALLEVRNAQDLQSKIDSNQGDVHRLTWEIQQLASQVQASNQLADALSQYDPANVQAVLKTSLSDVQGSADKPQWMKSDTGGIPSLAAVTANIAALQSQITDMQAAIKSLGDQRNEQLAKSDQISQQAEKANGSAGVELFKQAAESRKKAEEIGVQVDETNVKLARAQTDLAVAQGQETVLNLALKDIGTKADQTASVWKTIQEQIANQREQAKSLLGEAGQVAIDRSDPTGGSTLASKSASLEEKLKLLRGLREDAITHLNSAIEFFKDAGQIATGLQSTLQTLSSDPKNEKRVDKVAWDAERTAMHPARYDLQQANALVRRANLALAAANDAAGVQRLAVALKPILQPTGQSLPPVMQDTENKLATDLKGGRQVADASYDAANELLGNVADGSGSDDQHRAAKIARISTQYAWYLLDLSVGDAKAADHLTQAKAYRDEMIKDGEQLRSLPAELAVAPTAAPAPVH